MLLVFLIALLALVVWIWAGDGTPKSKLVQIMWLVAQVCGLATAFHYMNKYLGH